MNRSQWPNRPNRPDRPSSLDCVTHPFDFQSAEEMDAVFYLNRCHDGKWPKSRNTESSTPASRSPRRTNLFPREWTQYNATRSVHLGKHSLSCAARQRQYLWKIQMTFRSATVLHATHTHTRTPTIKEKIYDLKKPVCQISTVWKDVEKQSTKHENETSTIGRRRVERSVRDELVAIHVWICIVARVSLDFFRRVSFFFWKGAIFASASAACFFLPHLYISFFHPRATGSTVLSACHLVAELGAKKYRSADSHEEWINKTEGNNNKWYILVIDEPKNNQEKKGERKNDYSLNQTKSFDIWGIIRWIQRQLSLSIPLFRSGMSIRPSILCFDTPFLLNQLWKREREGKKKKRKMFNNR